MQKNISELTQVIIKNVVNDFKEDVFGNVRVLQGIVQTDAFVGLEIPNNANAREFQEGANTKKMKQTLIRHPERFVLNNNGIRIIASQVTRNTDGTYTLYFDKNEGVVNGNHTASVLRTHGLSGAYVPVFIQIGDFNAELLSEMSTSLNSHKRLEERDRQNKLNKHAWVKEVLGDDYDVQYNSGGEGSISIDDVLRRAYIFYPDDKGNFHERAGTYRVVSKAPFHKLNENDKLQYTRYILKDAMALYDFIKHDKKFIQLLTKPALNKFIDKDGTVHQGLVLHTLSLAKAYMYAPNRYATWCKNVNLDYAKAQLQNNYKNVIDILKVQKYKDLTQYDVLGDINIFNTFENLRKNMQIEFITEQASK